MTLSGKYLLLGVIGKIWKGYNWGTQFLPAQPPFNIYIPLKYHYRSQGCHRRWLKITVLRNHPLVRHIEGFQWFGAALSSPSHLNSHVFFVPMFNHAELSPGPTVHFILCVSVSLLSLSLSPKQWSPFIY